MIGQVVMVTTSKDLDGDRRILRPIQLFRRLVGGAGHRIALIGEFFAYTVSDNQYLFGDKIPSSKSRKDQCSIALLYDTDHGAPTNWVVVSTPGPALFWAAHFSSLAIESGARFTSGS